MRKLTWICFSVLLSIGFIACDDDDNTNVNSSTVKKCLLTELSTHTDGDTMDYSMSYDSQNRISSVVQSNGITTQTFNYDYSTDGLSNVSLTNIFGDTLIKLDLTYTNSVLSAYTLSNSASDDTVNIAVNANSDGTLNYISFVAQVDGDDIDIQADYTYDANGNVTNVRATTEFGIFTDIEVFNVAFEYDEQENPLKGIFVELDDVQSLINFNSPNNIQKVEISEIDEDNPFADATLAFRSTLNYSYNSNDLPEEVNITDIEIPDNYSETSQWTYGYTCP